MALGTQEIDSVCGHQPLNVDACESYELLLRCLRRTLHPCPTSESQCIRAEEVCWPALLALAHRHEVVPLLRIGLCDVSSVPEEVQRWLETCCRTVVAHNLSLASELIGLFELFEAFKLTAMPFKGPAWTMALYGNLAIRQIADLDIFIEKSQARQLFKHLMDRGYVLHSHSKNISSEEIRLNHKDVELIHVKTGVHLELHWSACEPWFDHRLCAMKLWEPASTTTVLEREMPIPSPEHLFFLLALHGFRDRWDSLKSICDIAAAIHAFPDLNWSGMLAYAAGLSRKRMVLLPLVLVQQLFDMQLADCVLEAIAQDQTVSALARQLQKQHYAGAESTSSTSNSVHEIFCRSDFVQIRSRESLVDRLRLLVVRVKPNVNDRQYLLPRTLPDPVYWLVRPFRLLTTYGPSIFFSLTAQLIRGR